VPERALRTAKLQSRNDLGELPAGSVNLSYTPCGSQGKNAQHMRHFKLVACIWTDETLRLGATGRAIAEFHVLFTIQIPAPLFLESSFSAPVAVT
jgi:hypothetical protein